MRKNESGQDEIRCRFPGLTPGETACPIQEKRTTLFRELIQDITAHLYDREDIENTRERRARILSAFVHFCEPNANAIAFLWLLDEKQGRSTAWISAATTSLGTAVAPIFRITMNGAPSSDFLSIHNTNNLLIISGALKNAGLDATAAAELFVPIVGGNNKNIFAVVHIIFHSEDLPFWKHQLSYFRVLGELLGAQITANRQQRINMASLDFQGKVLSAPTHVDACREAAKLLRQYTNALRCTIFIESYRDTLTIAADDCAANQPPEDPISNTIAANLLKGRKASGAPEGTASFRLWDLWDAKERRLVLEEDDITLSGLGSEGSQPEAEAWLAVVVAVDVYNSIDRRLKVPLLVLRLTSCHRNGIPGGIFSAHDEFIAASVGRYLGNLIPGLLLREGIHQIAERTGAIQKTIRDNLARNEFGRLEKAFNTLASELLPIIQSSMAVRSNARGEECNTHFWDLDGKSVKNEPPFRRSPGVSSMVSSQVPRPFIDITLLATDQRLSGIRCHLRRNHIAEHEGRILEAIISEFRFAALAEPDLHDRTIQISEIRHALRGGLMGVRGHLETAMKIFIAAREAYKCGAAEEAAELLLDQGAFHKSMARAMLAGEQVNTLFEDARLLMTDIQAGDLQRSLCNVGDVVKGLRELFLVETSRRRVEIDMIDDYPKTLISPSCDRHFLRLCLFNLLDNAVKYSFTDTRITITIRGSGQGWSVSIKDIGRHIPEGKVRDDIFQPFIRSRPPPGIQAMPGTGIGLAGARMVAKLFGGNIEVRSDPLASPGDDGTVLKAETEFTLRVPFDRRVRQGRIGRLG